METPAPTRISPGSKPPRRRRWLKRCLAAGAILLLVLVGLVAALPTILSSEWARERIDRELEARLDAPVELGAISLSWSGPQTVARFAIGPEKKRFVDASSIRVDGSLYELAFGTSVIRVTASAARLEVERAASGELAIPGAKRKESAPEPAPAPESRERRSADDVAIPRALEVVLERAEIHVNDLASRTRIVSEGHRIRVDAEGNDVRLKADPGEPLGDSSADATGGSAGAKVSGRLQLVTEALELAPVLSLELHLVLGRGGARVESSRIVLHGGMSLPGLTIDELSTNLRFLDGRIELSGTEARVGEGRLRAQTLTLDLNADPPRWSIDIDADRLAANVDLAPALAYVFPFLALEDRTGKLSGAIAGRLQLAGVGFSLESLTRSLTGSGSIGLVEGNVEGSRLFQELGTLVGFGLDQLAFRELASKFEIGNGVISVGSSRIDTKAGSKVRNLGLAGTTHIDGSMDWGVDLAAVESTTGDDRALRILSQARAILGDKGFPIRVGGTLAAPELRFTPVVQETLGRVLSGDPKAVEAIGGAVRDGLGDKVGRDGKKILDIVEGVLGDGLEGGPKKGVEASVDAGINIGLEEAKSALDRLFKKKSRRGE